MTKLTSIAVHAMSILKKLLALSSLEIFRDMSFLLDFVITMSKCTIITKLTFSKFPIAADFSLVLYLEIFFSSWLRRPNGF